jgi:hypothetical protein
MIRAWNKLGQDATIYEGQLLLVQKGATQPPPATQTSLPSRTPLMTGTPTPLTMLPGFPTMTLHPPQTAVPEESGNSTAPSLGFWVGLIVFVTAAAAFVAAWFIRPPK